MRKYGLIGYPLSHSFSPSFFSKKFEREGIVASYESYEMEGLDELHKLFDLGILGLNVTIPHKQNVIPYLNRLSPEAQAVGAVNTIKVVGDELHGYNTDVYGYRQSLLKMRSVEDYSSIKTLILGSGGGAKAVQYVMEGLGSSCYRVSRNLSTGADFIYSSFRYDSMSKYGIIVNTTPLGMYPNIDVMPPIPYWELHSNQLVYDLIYNPEKTLLLKRAENKGCSIQNGLEMLILQAERSWEIWNSDD